MGRFSNEWSDLQDAFYARDPEDTKRKRRSGLRWQIRVISLLWAQWFHVWEMRNKDLHGANAKEEAEAARRAAYRDLREIYDVREQLDRPLQALLLENVETHMLRPICNIQNWLTMHAQLFRDGIRRWRDRARTGTRSITTYFGPRITKQGT